MYPISRFAEMHIIASPEGPQSLVGSLGPDTKEICAARLSRPKSETLPVVFFFCFLMLLLICLRWVRFFRPRFLGVSGVQKTIKDGARYVKLNRLVLIS